MSFKAVLESIKKEYNYRIKTVSNLDDDKISDIECHLQKYGIVEMKPMKRTVIQQNPMDFTGITACEVCIVDVVTNYPVSPNVLRGEIRVLLDVPEEYVIVRGDGDPLELQNNELNTRAEIDAEADAEGLVRDSMLSTNSDYSEQDIGELKSEDLFGDMYNNNLLIDIFKVQEELPITTEYPIDSAMYNWDWNKGIPTAANINAGLDDYQPYVGKPSKTNTAMVSEKTTSVGNLDDEGKVVKVGYRNPKTGKRTVIRKKTANMRG